MLAFSRRQSGIRVFWLNEIERQAVRREQVICEAVKGKLRGRNSVVGENRQSGTE